MGELADLRLRLKNALEGVLKAEDNYMDSYDTPTVDSPEYRALRKAERAEENARNNLRMYLECPELDHSQVIFEQVDVKTVHCFCPDCRDQGREIIGRGPTQQAAFDDFHERMGTNACKKDG